MDKSIFEIRGNINHSFTRIECIRKEREEREKKEREERMAKEREERKKKEDEWSKEHPILAAYTYISFYNYETYTWPGIYCNVHFYEWSNIDNAPHDFSHSIEFYKFLDSCKINLTSEQHRAISSCTGLHITCLEGTHDLVIGKTYDDLKEKINLAKLLDKIPDAQVPEDNIYYGYC